MHNPQGQPVIYLVGLASIFVILFGSRGSAYTINLILLAADITITVLAVRLYRGRYFYGYRYAWERHPGRAGRGRDMAGGIRCRQNRKTFQ